MIELEEDIIGCGAESEDLFEPVNLPLENSSTSASVCPPSPPLPVCVHLVSVTFREGGLGLILKKKHGVVVVEDVQDGTQACDLDIERGDEVWSCFATAEGQARARQVGGGEPVTKERWEELVTFLRDTRPLTCQLLRRENKIDPFPVEAELIAMREASSSIGLEKSTELSSTPAGGALALLAETMVWKERATTASSLAFLRPKSPPTADTRGEEGGSLAEFLVQPGRRLVKEGDLEVRIKGSLFGTTTQARRFFLFNDLLIITIPTSPKFTVDTVVELVSAKVYSHGQSFGEGASKSNSIGFEIHAPGGIVQVLASDEEREMWVLALFLSICELHNAGSSKACGWKHQILLGTMHSAVITGDVQRVKDLLRAAEVGDLDYSVVECPDDDALTPLHYACILRQFDIVALLHGANADVTIGDNDGKSPIHWASLQLDNLSLGLLCANVFDVDLIDKHDRTPLFLACVEGRDVMGRVNGPLLKSVVKTLLEAGANPDGLVTSDSYLPHQYLASANDCHEALELLLEAGASINYTHNDQSALHLAIRQSIKPTQGEGAIFLNKICREDSQSSSAKSATVKKTGCIRTLLQHGAKPNLKSYEGKAALHLIADNADNLGGQSSVCEMVSMLIAYGARMDDTQQCTLLRSICAEKVSFEALAERWANMGPANADAVNLGVNSLSSNTSETNGVPSLQTPPLCQLCCAAFTLFRRQHHCRMCSALTCDECSKRRATVRGANVRCCDACFNRVLHKSERQQQLSQSRGLTTASLVNVVRPFSPSQKDAAPTDKDQLLAGAPSQTTKSVAKSSGGIAATKATMEEVGDRLKERGEKLSQLSDKSADLSNAAENFHRLAKQLNEQKSTFW